MVRFRLVSLLGLAACGAPSQPAPHVAPAPAQAVAIVPASIATPADPVPELRLPTTFAPSAYTAHLTIDPGQPRFTGHIEIAGTIAERTSVVWLHAKGLEFTTPVEHHGDDLIALRYDTALEPGPLTITLDYTGAIDPINTAGTFSQRVGGASYVFTQHEALYARRTFPCIDEPSTKVPWTLTLDVPRGNVAVANTPVAHESDAGELHRYEFEPTRPLPSYLIAFAVGPFDVVSAGTSKSGAPVRIVTMKGRSADAAFAAQSTARIVDLLEAWFDMPFPYPKLDILTVPLTVGFGAMENPGLITVDEQLMLLDPKKPSAVERNGYVTTAAHEIAHQWFGDLVTLAWWDDVWLNEGFAEWMETKIAGQYDPTWKPEQVALGERNAGLDADAIVSARSVRQPIVAVGDIEGAFDGITYQKAAGVLAMFESYVGADAFQRGIRAYVAARAHATATATDFIDAIGKASGKDLGAAFASFLDRPGAPEITATLACDKAGTHVVLAQERYVPPGSPAPAAQAPWQVPICVAFEQNGKRGTTCTLLSAETGTLALPAKRCPRWIMPNVGGLGYYRVRYTKEQVKALRDEAWDALAETEQRAVFFDVSAAARRGDGRIPLLLALSFVPKLIAIGDQFAIGEAVQLPLGFERVVPAPLADKFAYYLRTTFGPGAAAVGVLPGAADTLDGELSRFSLVDAAAWHGRDPDLVAKAVELARNWRDLPIAIRRTVLVIAIDADPELGARTMREIKTEHDRARRGEMFDALASVRDVKRYEAALALILDPAIDAREAMDMLHTATTGSTRDAAERWVRENQSALLARMPRDSITGLNAWFAKLFTASCDRSRRAEAREYVDAHFASLPGGTRAIDRSGSAGLRSPAEGRGGESIDQVFEAMDQCIAERERLAPQLRGWLSGIKIPRPAKR
jgi:alanyl aminopeptidase